MSNDQPLELVVARLRDENNQLRRAMRTRAVIEQAKGVLVERMGCTPEDAFERLVKLSQETNIKLVEVAAGLVGTVAPTVEDPGALLDPSPLFSMSRHPSTKPRPPRRQPVRHPQAAQRVQPGTVPRARRPQVDGEALPAAPAGSTSAGPKPAAPTPGDGSGGQRAGRVAGSGRPGAREAVLRAAPRGRTRLVAAAIDSAQSPDEIARILVTDALSSHGVVAAVLAVLESAGSLRLVGTYGLPSHVIRDWLRIPAHAEVPLADAVRSVQPVWLASLDERNRRYPPVQVPVSHGQAWASLPLVAGDRTDRTLGALGLVYRDPHPFPPQQKRFLLALARHCASAMQRMIHRGDDLAGPVTANPVTAALHAVFDTFIDPVTMLTPVRDAGARVVDFRISACSEAVVDLEGRHRDEIVGRRLLELYPGVVPSGLFDAYCTTLKSGIPFRQDELTYVEPLANGMRSSVVSIRVSRFLDGLVVTWRDLNEEHLQAAQFDLTERLCRLGTWEWDLHTDLVFWSPGLYSIFGQSPGDGPLTLESVNSAVHPVDFPVIEHAAESLLLLRRPVDVEHRVIRPDGAVRSVRIVAEPVFDGGDRVVAVRGVTQDVTEQRRVEQELSRVKDELLAQRRRVEEWARDVQR